MHPLQQGPSRLGWQTELQQHAARQRQPAGSPLAGPGNRFGPQLQPAGAGKALGVGLGRGDE